MSETVLRVRQLPKQAEKDLIRAGYEDGRSVASIAAILGKSRGQVIGIANRMGLAHPKAIRRREVCPADVATIPIAETLQIKQEIKVDLETNRLLVGGRDFKVPPAVAELAHVFTRSGLRRVTYAEIALALWGASGGPECANEAIRVYIHRLRKALSATRWTVVGVRSSHTADGTGYYMLEKEEARYK